MKTLSGGVLLGKGESLKKKGISKETNAGKIDWYGEFLVEENGEGKKKARGHQEEKRERLLRARRPTERGRDWGGCGPLLPRQPCREEEEFISEGKRKKDLFERGELMREKCVKRGKNYGGVSRCNEKTACLCCATLKRRGGQRGLA